MSDQDIRTALERLSPPRAAGTWEDVVRRATHLRRRRRRRTFSVALATLVFSLVAALAAGGQIDSLLPHSKEPHLLVRTQLALPDGTRIGTVEVELHGAAVVFGRGIELRRWTPGHQSNADKAAPYAIRWFLELDDAALNLAGGSLTLAGRSGGSSVTLCSDCHASASGRLKISVEAASLLVRNLTRATYRAGSNTSAVGMLALQRSRMRRAILCTPGRGTSLLCSPIFPGR